MRFNGGFAEVFIQRAGSNDRVDVRDKRFGYIFNTVSDVEIDCGIDRMARIRVTFTPSQRDAVDALLNSGLFGFGVSQPNQQRGLSSEASKPSDWAKGNLNILGVRARYEEDVEADGEEATTPWYVGLIFTPKLSVQNGEFTITLNSVGFGQMLAFSERVNYAAFSGMPGDEAIVAIFNATDPDLTAVITDEAQTALSKFRFNAADNRSPYEAIRSLCAEAGVKMYDGPSSEEELTSGKRSIYFKVSSTDLFTQRAPKYKFAQFNNNFIPVMSYQMTEGEQLFFSGYAFGSTTASYDEKLKTSSTVVDAEGNIGVPENQADDTGNFQTGRVTEDFDSSSKGANERQDTATALLKFSLQVPGMPGLLPMQINQFIFGDYLPGLSGKFLTEKVVHRIGSAGWVTDMECRMMPQDKLQGAASASVASNLRSRFPI